MTDFERVGRMIDRELEKLRRFFDHEMRPTTERRLVAALRAASRRLESLARDLEARGTAKPPSGEAN